jgi:hypothetical protein
MNKTQKSRKEENEINEEVNFTALTMTVTDSICSYVMVSVQNFTSLGPMVQ